MYQAHEFFWVLAFNNTHVHIGIMTRMIWQWNLPQRDTALYSSTKWPWYTSSEQTYLYSYLQWLPPRAPGDCLWQFSEWCSWCHGVERPSRLTHHALQMYDSFSFIKYGHGSISKVSSDEYIPSPHSPSIKGPPHIYNQNTRCNCHLH